MRSIFRSPFIIAVLLGSPVVYAGQASFDFTGLRYLSGHDVFRVLNQKFPHGFVASEEECKKLSVRNRVFLGTSLPILGEPALKSPSPAFVSWYSKCILKMIPQELTDLAPTPDGLGRFLGEDALVKIAGTPMAVIRNHGAYEILWSALSVDLQQAIALGLIHELVGLNIIKSENDLAGWLITLPISDSKIKVAGALEKMIFALAIRDEFLTY